MVVVKRPPNPDYEPEVDVGEKVIIPTPNVRQGVGNHNVRNVLALSLMGVIVLFGVIYLFFFSA